MSYLARTDLRGRRLGAAALRAALPRADFDIEAAARAVRPVLDDVAAPVRDWSETFDGVRPDAVRVPAEALTAALADLDPDIRSAIELSIARLRAVNAGQVRADDVTRVAPGATVSRRWAPVQRVGLYVPGGRAVLVSSVLMNVVPAQVAGVASLAVASPPQKEFGGLPHPTILAACELLGIDEVYAAGGAQAIGLLAHGGSGLEAGGAAPQTCDPVDLITGPGNVYVTAAKRTVSSFVGIDSEAGPTEIGVLADGTANPTWVAYDLVSQAEHDPLAAAVLITDSAELADTVDAEIDRIVPAARHAERIAESLSSRQSGIVLVDDEAHGVSVANAYAAEHLEVQTVDPHATAAKIVTAGAIFIGPFSPVPLGDYVAGSNHVLPTSGTARYSEGLGVQTFLRGIDVIDYAREGLESSRKAAVTLANAEDLPSHGEGIEARFRD